ncbi:MAG TPA: hypothetical protein VFV38_17425, partial [Ktedonobacteraceae bacterium]|nr:hypothetical protein [Ktedonobacteraceae bacterium]
TRNKGEIGKNVPWRVSVSADVPSSLASNWRGNTNHDGCVNFRFRQDDDPVLHFASRRPGQRRTETEVVCVPLRLCRRGERWPYTLVLSTFSGNGIAFFEMECKFR